METSRKHCYRCGQDVLVTADSTNHILHLLLSIITGGLWLVIWAIAANLPKDWKCTKCGDSVSVWR